MNKHIPTKYSTLILFLIFVIGLASVGWLEYVFNIQHQKSSLPFSNGPVTTAPKTLNLDLSSPDDESLFFKSSILISGQTSPLKEVLIYTDSQNLVIKSKTDGSFSTSLDLDEGINNIKVVVFDVNGDTREVERTVYYSEEKL